jgi:hypothetical protein
MGKRILVQYRTNEEYHPDFQPFFADYIYDVDCIRKFVEDGIENGEETWLYSFDEAEHIIRIIDHDGWPSFDAHDKYTFYDTADEREKVIADKDNNEEIIKTITVYLNS